MRCDWFRWVDEAVQMICAEQCIHFYEITVGPHHVQYHVSRDGYVSKAYEKVQAQRLEDCVRKLEKVLKKPPAKGPGANLRVTDVAMSTGDGFWAPYIVVRTHETGVWP